MLSAVFHEHKAFWALSVTKGYPLQPSTFQIPAVRWFGTIKPSAKYRTAPFCQAGNRPLIRSVPQTESLLPFIGLESPQRISRYLCTTRNLFT